MAASYFIKSGFGYVLTTEETFISFFKEKGLGANFTYYTKGMSESLLIDTDIWKMDTEFLDTLKQQTPLGVNILFKHSTKYSNTWQKNSNTDTFPVEDGLKNIPQVLKLINTKSIHFIMED